MGDYDEGFRFPHGPSSSFEQSRGQQDARRLAEERQRLESSGQPSGGSPFSNSPTPSGSGGTGGAAGPAAGLTFGGALILGGGLWVAGQFGSSPGLGPAVLQISLMCLVLAGVVAVPAAVVALPVAALLGRATRSFGAAYRATFLASAAGLAIPLGMVFLVWRGIPIYSITFLDLFVVAIPGPLLAGAVFKWRLPQAFKGFGGYVAASALGLGCILAGFALGCAVLLAGLRMT
jgi:hypothetical protein